MSRTVTKIINGFIGAVTYPLSERQKEKIFATVGETIGRGGVRTVGTGRGTLRFYTTRGHSAATEVRSFPKGESETVEWVDRFVKPGEVLWDIGANIGLYALYAGLDPAVKVYAFEPSALNFALLTEHVQLNGRGDSVHPLCIALGPETKIGFLQMRNFSTGHWGNALDNAQNQFERFDAVFSQAVPAARADDLCRFFNLPAPDHIKLDVDGIEDLILTGAPDTLPRVKSLIVEIEGRNVDNFAQSIEAPLNRAGLFEDLAWRDKGSKRNRVFVNRALAA